MKGDVQDFCTAWGTLNPNSPKAMVFLTHVLHQAKSWVFTNDKAFAIRLYST